MNDHNYNHEINQVIEKVKDINQRLDYVNKLVKFYEDNHKTMDNETIERFAKLVQTEFKSVSQVFDIGNE